MSKLVLLCTVIMIVPMFRLIGVNIFPHADHVNAYYENVTFNHKLPDKSYFEVDDMDKYIYEYIDVVSQKYDHHHFEPGSKVNLTCKVELNYTLNCSHVYLFVWMREVPYESATAAYEIIHDYLIRYRDISTKERRVETVHLPRGDICTDITIEVTHLSLYQRMTVVLFFASAFVHGCQDTELGVNHSVVFDDRLQSVEETGLIHVTAWLNLSIPDPNDDRLHIYECTYDSSTNQSIHKYRQNFFILSNNNSVQTNKFTLSAFPRIKWLFVLLTATNDNYYKVSSLDDIFFNLEVVWRDDFSVIPLNSTKYSVETRVLNNHSSSGIPFVQSKLTIRDVNETDFGNYTCTVSCLSRTNKSGGQRKNFCPQQRTIELEPDDWKMQAIRFKDVANHFGQSTQMYFSRVEELENRSNILGARISYLTVYRDIVDAMAFFVSVGLSLILVFSCIYLFIRMRKKQYYTQVLELLRNLPETQEYSNQAQLKYDVFLSYSNVDREWVGRTLLPYLEDQNYKVCFGERDFKYGKILVNSIASSIYKSRKTIALISPEYLQSRWCVDHELIFTITKILNKDGPSDSLLTVKFRPCKIPRELMMSKYLDYTDNYVKPHFFEDLCKWLGPPVIGTQCETL